MMNYHGQRITRQGLWKILKEYGKKAGLEEKLTPNIIRNSFAVHMLQNGADLKSLQELMGHEDLSATEVYLSVTKKSELKMYMIKLIRGHRMSLFFLFECYLCFES